MRWRLLSLNVLLMVAIAAIVPWVLHGSVVDHWLAVHTGTVNEPGPYYAFWSGFGSDLAEFGMIGAIGTGVYQLVKRYNCHQLGCWRVGNHPAANGQFVLCYRHHPDYQGRRPTAELIARLHREQRDRELAIHDKLLEIHQQFATSVIHHTGSGSTG